MKRCLTKIGDEKLSNHILDKAGLTLKDAYSQQEVQQLVKAAKDIQQQHLSSLNDIYAGLGIKGYTRTTQPSVKSTEKSAPSTRQTIVDRLESVKEANPEEIKRLNSLLGGDTNFSPLGLEGQYRDAKEAGNNFEFVKAVDDIMSTPPAKPKFRVSAEQVQAAQPVKEAAPEKVARQKSDRQEKINNLRDRVSSYNKMRETNRNKPAALNELRLDAEQLGLNIDYGKGHAILKYDSGLKVQRRSAVTNDTVVKGFNPATYSQVTQDAVNKIIADPALLVGLALKGEDGYRFSQAQLDNAVESIKDGKPNQGAKSLYEFFEHAKDGKILLEDRTTGNELEVPIEQYFAATENVQPATDDDVDALNTQLGEEAFNDMFDETFDDNSNIQNEQQTIPAERVNPAGKTEQVAATSTEQNQKATSNKGSSTNANETPQAARTDKVTKLSNELKDKLSSKTVAAEEKKVIPFSSKNVPAATGNFEVVEVRPYTDQTGNNFRPDQQLRFGQGTHYEAVILAGDDDLIELIQIGSREHANINGANPRKIIDDHAKERIEKKLGITSHEAYNKARELAKQNRNSKNETIIVLGSKSAAQEKPAATSPDTEIAKAQEAIDSIATDDEKAVLQKEHGKDVASVFANWLKGIGTVTGAVYKIFKRISDSISKAAAVLGIVAASILTNEVRASDFALNDSTKKFVQNNKTLADSIASPPTRKRLVDKYGPVMADRWTDYRMLDVKSPDGRTYREIFKEKADKFGITPEVLFASSAEEGFRLFMKDGGEVDIRNNSDDKEYPVNGFTYFGLDNFTDFFPDLVNAKLLPDTFMDNFNPTKAVNEKNEKVNSANFKTAADAIEAKAAMMAYIFDQVDAYSQEHDIKLSDAAIDFFTVVGYNAGFGNAKKMMTDYNAVGALKNDSFLKQRPVKGNEKVTLRDTSWEQPYTNAMRRIIPAMAWKDGKFLQPGKNAHFQIEDKTNQTTEKVVSDFVRQKLNEGEDEATIKEALVDNGYTTTEAQDIIDGSKDEKQITLGVIGQVGKWVGKLFGGKQNVYIAKDQQSLIDKVRELGSDIKYQVDVNTAYKELEKAKRNLQNAENKIAAAQVRQTEIGGEALQGSMFGVNRDEAKAILDPLRQKVREAQSAVAEAEKNVPKTPGQNLSLFMNSGGDILGFTHNNKIYLNGEKLNPETPIHEAGHIWTEWAKDNATDLYDTGVKLIQNSQYLMQVKANPFYQSEAKKLPVGERETYYQHEALATAIGDKGAKFISDAKKKGFTAWAKELWDRIGKALGFKNIQPDELANLTLDEFAQRAAIDILKTDVTPRQKVTVNEVEQTAKDIRADKITFQEAVRGKDDKFIDALNKELTGSSRFNLDQDVFRENIRKQRDYGVSKEDVIANLASAKKITNKQMNIIDEVFLENAATNQSLEELQDAIRKLAQGLKPKKVLQRLSASNVASLVKAIKDHWSYAAVSNKQLEDISDYIIETIYDINNIGDFIDKMNTNSLSDVKQLLRAKAIVELQKIGNNDLAEQLVADMADDAVSSGRQTQSLRRAYEILQAKGSATVRTEFARRYALKVQETAEKMNQRLSQVIADKNLEIQQLSEKIHEKVQKSPGLLEKLKNILDSICNVRRKT